MLKRPVTKCLSIEELSGFIEGTIYIHSRERIEDHLLDCSLCYDAVTALSEPEASDYLLRINSLNQDIKLKYNSGFRSHRALYSYYISSAAVLLVMLFSYLFYFNQSASEKLFNEYYKPYPNVIPMVRGEGIDFDLKAAMVLYNSGNYRDAVTEFDKVLLFEEHNEIAAFYKAVSYISLGNYEKALPVLRKIGKDPLARFNDQADWYKALAYLGMEQDDKAVMILQQIINENNYFSDRAASLLEKIAADE